MTNSDYMTEQVDCGHGHILTRSELISGHACPEITAARDRGARLMDALALVPAGERE